MTPEARIAAAIDILDALLSGEPAERTLTNWARGHRFAGSGDRAAIRDLVFDAIRRRRSLAWLGAGESGRALMLGRLRAMGTDPASVFTGARYAPPKLTEDEAGAGRSLEDAPDPVRLDCPDWLWPLLEKSLGKALRPTLAILQQRAPVFLRANLIHTTRDAVRDALAGEGIGTRPHHLAETALEVTEGARKVQSSQAYQNGLVELQDAASQAVVARLADHLGGAEVLDYCAGGGGKALALAALGAARVTAHDVDQARMKDLPARAERAGAKIAIETAPTGAFDLVLCDAPCSGSGAWRRQPEAKWRLTADRLSALNATQDGILDTASSLVRPGGVLAYATCSLLSEENGERADAFLARHGNWVEIDRLTLLPGDGGDGFFLAVFRKS